MKKSNELRKGLMLVLSSPSGAGKTSICKKVISLDRKISLSISYTTRPKRKSEKEGKDYFFVSQEKFEDLKKKSFFIEFANVFDHWYGTPKDFIEKNLNNGEDVIFDIDWQGAQNSLIFRKMMLYQFLFYHQVIKNFMRDLKKSEDSLETVCKRMSKARSEISHWIEYDYVLINDNLENCSSDVLNILNAERKKEIDKNLYLTLFLNY